jgi:chemotaxis protein MotA
MPLDLHWPVACQASFVSSTAAVLREASPVSKRRAARHKRIDVFMLTGVVIVAIALVAGIASTGIHLQYFFQPTGALIVLGGTLGVTFITTPRHTLLSSVRRVRELLWAPQVNREALIEEILGYVRASRSRGLLDIEPRIAQASDPFLKETLLLTLDVNSRPELQAALETKVRLHEREGEADAKMLEVAGGFAPTIGVLGTVVGLIDVLRQFTNPGAASYGIGTAFVSTIYGLGLANFVLLPAAHRIRARVADSFEIQELICEGAMCLFDRIHPSLVRERLNAFLRTPKGR